MASVTVTLTDKNFSAEVLSAGVPVLVDFWAAWCSPCRMIAPVIDELAQDYLGRVKVGKLNVDDNANTSAQYGVMSIPTLILFKEGKAVDKIVGAVPKRELQRRMDAVL
ncbi:MAG TPA: thioredoxin [Clostridiales bacterium UBA8153]|nr:thioredoxin [Clostridiales bacterium UBA8153]